MSPQQDEGGPIEPRWHHAGSEREKQYVRKELGLIEIEAGLHNRERLGIETIVKRCVRRQKKVRKKRPRAHLIENAVLYAQPSSFTSFQRETRQTDTSALLL